MSTAEAVLEKPRVGAAEAILELRQATKRYAGVPAIETVFPHPTISEAMHESVLAAYGRVIHI